MVRSHFLRTADKLGRDLWRAHLVSLQQPRHLQAPDQHVTRTHHHHSAMSVSYQSRPVPTTATSQYTAPLSFSTRQSTQTNDKATTSRLPVHKRKHKINSRICRKKEKSAFYTNPTAHIQIPNNSNRTITILSLFIQKQYTYV